jgi:hypothetical protein
LLQVDRWLISLLDGNAQKHKTFFTNIPNYSILCGCLPEAFCVAYSERLKLMRLFLVA